MTDESQVEQPGYAVAMATRDLISVLVLGGIAGLVVWGICTALNRYVFDVIFCQHGVANFCANETAFSEGTAMLIASIVALVGLIRIRAYRPLLVVLASVASLWGTAQLSLGTTWYWSLMILVVMYALAFGLYSWVARLRRFWLALLITLVLVISVRLALSL